MLAPDPVGSPRAGVVIEAGASTTPSPGRRLILWIPVMVACASVLLLPRPEGITSQSWRLLAVFAGTIAGLIFQPLPVGAMVLLGVAAVAFSGAAPIAQALAGWSEPAVWMVLAAFSISRGMIKTGLGRRIAFLFIRAIGQRMAQKVDVKR